MWSFLKVAYDDFRKLPNAGPEVLTNIHAYRGAADDLGERARCPATGIIGRAGWFMGDMSCAIMQGTWEAVYWSAQNGGVAAADAVIAGERARASGCAARPAIMPMPTAPLRLLLSQQCRHRRRALRTYSRAVASSISTRIMANGTQAIFYRRADVFYGSVHTDPSLLSAFRGYAERRVRAGAGFNLNLPLAQGMGDAEFIAANAALPAR